MTKPDIQTSFAGGEISPSLYARTDIAKYQVGAATVRNFFCDYRGGASTRAGSRMLTPVKDSTKRTRLIPFIVGNDASYSIELGDEYARFYSNGAPITEATKTITGITRAMPGVITSAAHGYTTGDWVYLAGIVGMTQLNARTFKVNVLSPNTFSLVSLYTNTAIDTSSYTVYVSGGTSARIYELVTPWTAETLGTASEIDVINYAQSADVLTIVSAERLPQDIERQSVSTFSITPFAPGAAVGKPQNLAATATDGGRSHTLSYGYAVTALDLDGREESLPSDQARVTNNYLVQFDAPQVMNHLTWDLTPLTSSYNIYKWGGIIESEPDQTVFGFIGQAVDAVFTDNNIAPDISKQPPQARNPFTSQFPSVVSYFQQRKVFAATENNPEGLWGSQIGLPNNFNVSFAVLDYEAFTFSLSSLQVNAIAALVPTSQGLVGFTSAGIWIISGKTAQEAITPSSISALPQASPGCAPYIQPLVINANILYVQFMGSVVREVSYTIDNFSFVSKDRSELAMHLFFGYTITEWCLAEEPFHLVWAVRDDGTLLSLTYTPANDIYAWAWHDTYGFYKSICSVPEPPTNAVYYIAQRFIQGTWLQCIERFVDRNWGQDVEYAWCVDCGLRTELTYPAAGIIVSARTGTVTVTADVPVFGVGDIGKVMRFQAGSRASSAARDVGGRGTVTGYTDTTHVTVLLDHDITLVIPTTHIPGPFIEGEWSMTAPVSSVYAEHLAGETVNVLADGNVLLDQEVGADGWLDLAVPASLVVVGFQFTAQLQTLYLDTGEPTIQGKYKLIPTVTARVQETRALEIGPTFSRMFDTTADEPGNLTSQFPIPLYTGDIRKNIANKWDRYGQICLRQTNPLPATVLGVIPEVELGSTN